MKSETDRLMTQAGKAGAPLPENPHLLEALEVYLAGLMRSHIGEKKRLALERNLVRVLQIRGWAENSSRHGQTVDTPVFILGMPRSGSTFLHHLVAQSHQLKPLTSWDAASPVPSAESLHPVREALRLETMDNRASMQTEKWEAWHLEGQHLPTEDTALLALDLRCWSIAAGIPLPSYEEWLMDTDILRAYEWHRDSLQFLGAPQNQSWVLHAPEHSLAIDALLHMYPDARFIVTWRDPTIAMASLIDYVVAERRFFNDPAPVSEFAERWVPRWAKGLRELAMRRDELARSAPERVVDVAFDELTHDPIKVAVSALERLGLDGEGARGAMETQAKAMPHGDGGNHHYDKAIPGLSDSHVQDLFEGVGPEHRLFQ